MTVRRGTTDRPVRCVGIDPSSAKVALTLTEKGNPKFDMRMVKLPEANHVKGCGLAYNFIDELCSEYKDCELIVVLEKPFTGKFASAGLAISRVQGAIEAAFYNNDVKVLLAPPTEWKKSIGLPGNCDKARIAGWLHQYWEAAWLAADGDQDCIDSAAINRHAFNIWRNSQIVKSKKTRIRRRVQ